MNRGETSDTIPTDLILEILSRLPTKSIARFRSVSRLWESMIGGAYFNELFLTKSVARPRYLFAVQRNDDLIFFSSPQPKDPYEKSPLVVATDFHVKLPKDIWLHFCGYACGLICLWYVRKEVDNRMHIICNPSTGQHVFLPTPQTGINSYNMLGFDPIDKRIKVISMVGYPSCGYDNKILTLETGELKWRKIKCPLYHIPDGKAICIDGVLYYFCNPVSRTSAMIVCFDVRSEKFKFIDTGNYWSAQLINYKGKLGRVHWGSCHTGNKLYMWILEDMEKQQWSKYVYTLGDNELKAKVIGVTATGEIVLHVNPMPPKPFYVVYFNPEKQTLQRVEIEGNHEALEDYFNSIFAFVDHVEDLKFNIVKKRLPEQKCKPTSKSTSSEVHLQQDPGTIESIKNKFYALSLI